MTSLRANKLPYLGKLLLKKRLTRVTQIMSPRLIRQHGNNLNNLNNA